MTTPYTIESAQSIFPSTQIANVVPDTIAAFDQLNAEDQLALIWFAYTEMGKTITVAALGAANMILAQGILELIKQMPPEAQTQVMYDLANRADTPICRSYASFTMNIKLGFWYQLGEWMEKGLVAPIPPGYLLSDKAQEVLKSIQAADAGQQITILRNTVISMGFDPNAPGSYKKVEDPIVAPTDISARTQVKIEGVTNSTVLDYINNMNANDFENASNLFTSEGALQPPFQRPIIGKEAILAYMREECRDLKMIPERGVVETPEEGYTPIKVTGTVQSPWFGASVGMNIAWRFVLDPQGKIFFVAIDLLASPKELLNLVRK
jgi:hypothetical protein